jgi:hypothetical protein
LRKGIAVEAIDALLRSLPGEEEVIRRLFWRDPRFRAVCEDYRDVCDVLARLERAQPADPDRVAEYRELAAELLAEAKLVLHEVGR